ncbi:MAG: PD40 domain-containing protein [Acidobacteria bacterium]|nr:PD40 domain-containing protein [Acidobacteriota bacterium]MCB9398331.1 PD40 domain-containing protein [Acidobacteriota bacterium]
MTFRTVLIWGFLYLNLAAADLSYFRFPDIHGNQVVFTSEGDLWIAALPNGPAHRLTTHPAEETQARFSPDGKQIAFEANYEGTTEIYTLPTSGGQAQRVTFEMANVRLQDWTADGQILYATNSEVGPTGNWVLKTIDPTSHATQPIPLADACEGALSPDGKTLFFTQFGLQLSTDNARIYRGGAEGEIWQYSMGSDQEAKKLTADHVGDARNPMWVDGRLFFISDANGNDQFWSMTASGQDLKAETQNSDWPIRTAQTDGQKIIFQQGADLKVWNSQDGSTTALNLQLVSDRPYLRERWLDKPLEYLTDAHPGSDGTSAILTARSQVIVAKTDGSRLVEIKTPTASRTRGAILNAAGTKVYALNDATGVMEIWAFAADGSDQSQQLTRDGSVFRWNLYLSPDENSLAYDDKAGDLWLLDIKSGKQQKIASGNNALSPFAHVVWSGDSKYIALTRNFQTDERSRISVYDLANQKEFVLTSDKYNSFAPSFSPDGAWLYFLSDRQFNPYPGNPWGDRDLGSAMDRRTQIFALPLQENSLFPFQEPSELTPKDPKPENQKGKLRPLDSAATQLFQIPVEAGNYSNLTVCEDFLYVDDQDGPNGEPKLLSLKLAAKAKLQTFGEAIRGFEFSRDLKWLLIRKGQQNPSFYVVKPGEKLPSDLSENTLQTKTWTMRLDPREEWRQMFLDAWLMHREFFYDAAMRQVDWNQVRQKYEPLLARVNDRYELNDVLGQMTGELNALHSQVRGGDYPDAPERAQAAHLGAELRQSEQGIQIAHIYRNDPELPQEQSPLAQPGVDAQTGDWIRAINGRPTPNLASLYDQLKNQSGKQVLLKLERKGVSHLTVVKPVSIGQAFQLRYKDWVYANQRKVQNVSDQIGYLHLYAMGSDDLADFAREFYAQYQKQGLIIDVRRNRGGNIDSMIIEKLLRRAWAFWQAPIGPASTNMQQTFRGHLVVLADQFTYSDGETFTAGIKALNLGPVIGKRTAGAGVWLRGLNRLTDGGMARVAEFPQYALDGTWIVEGYGVSPDIEVDNLPLATGKGTDAQLTAAITYLQDKIKQEPIPKLGAKPFPGKDQPAQDLNP